MRRLLIHKPFSFEACTLVGSISLSLVGAHACLWSHENQSLSKTACGEPQDPSRSGVRSHTVNKGVKENYTCVVWHPRSASSRIYCPALMLAGSGHVRQSRGDTAHPWGKRLAPETRPWMLTCWCLTERFSLPTNSLCKLGPHKIISYQHLLP